MSYAEIAAQARADTRTLVRVERRPGHAVVTMSDPGKLNMLSAAMTVQLQDALAELTADPEVRAIVLTGADPGFNAGGDLSLMADTVRRLADPADEEGATMPWRWIRYQFGGCVRLIAGSDTLVVSALNGAAAGVGLALAFASDLVVASERAVIVPAFGRLGLLPEVGTSWHLTHRLGYQRAVQYYLSGEHIDAAKALEYGLVNEVVPHEELLARALWWCERALATPEHAQLMAVPLLRQAASMTWEQALVMEEFAEPNCFTTKDFARSVDAMLGRR
ncbi:enoyl-CoA hydratase/isomerase family protein [Actinomadura macrotermitis]|uniref:4-chlorobenzoyl coenzyme A dehalogenase-2 n=1 Tax=Actinomadura macrotermitis TaxID=2585200 RepID=A0A7K0BX30_9ACTN|nr:enoyl-CoA hydratase/isomerase family protein [Actinomadura macrotermitis]MQY05741.1 4-chlorobenzoyl coenzyme A dehalogenase-2 [Actinomadura macrotermitis]